MKFDDFFIDQVRNSVNIVDVVQDYVRLVKKGQNYQALCPFHSEKTPSFSVSASKQIFKCFGCGAAGDVFAFISKIENLSFPESVRLLAEKNGIKVPESSSGPDRHPGQRKRLLEVMSAAAGHYMNILSGDPDLLDFLESIGISNSTRQRFQLGCDDGSLPGHLSRESFSKEDIRLCGLDNAPAEPGVKSLVFPLTDISGRILNFAYMRAREGGKEKICSPDTLLFQGDRGFFGLHLARQAIKEKDYVILTDKAVDAMLLLQNGIPNTVACIGKGVSVQQARILGRNTKKVIINHLPGMVEGPALLQTFESLLSEGFTINVAALPYSTPLGEFLQRESLSAYIRVLKSSQPIFDYLLDLYLDEASEGTDSGRKQELLSQIRQLLGKIPSKIASSEYKRRIAGRLKIPVSELEGKGEESAASAGLKTPPVPSPGDASVSNAIERDNFLNFSPEFREKVRSACDLVEIISTYQKLVPRNHLLTGKCPFHPDIASSLKVSRDKRLFKCPVCGTGGDLFSYVSRFEEISLSEAILDLARKAGIPLPEIPGEEDAASDHRLRLMHLMQEAAGIFKAELQKKSAALEYLDGRGIDESTREKFDFGYAPPGNLLLKHLQEKGFTLDEIEAAGLAVRNDSGEYYDKFRNRIMLSIKDTLGRIIAFGGRAMGDFLPKYLNSPETLLYNKRKQLFGLSDAREQISEEDFAILVEGYFDCVIPSQFGVANIVASLGTSLTEQQVNLLGGFTRNILICFDPDSAGREAAVRSINLFLARNFKVRVMQLPEGKDPDSVIIEDGIEAFRELIATASPFVDFIIRKNLEASPSAMSPQGKQKIVNQLIPSLLMVPDKVERSQMAAQAAALLKLDEKLLLEEMRRFPRQGDRIPAPASSSDPALKHTNLSERILLKALLGRDKDDRQLDKIEPSLFEHSAIKEVFRTTLALRKQGVAPEVTRVWDELDDDQRDLLEYLAVSEEFINTDKESIQSCIDVFKEKDKVLRIREIQEKIAKKESNPDDSENLMDLLEELKRLRNHTPL